MHLLLRRGQFTPRDLTRNRCLKHLLRAKYLLRKKKYTGTLGTDPAKTFFCFPQTYVLFVMSFDNPKSMVWGFCTFSVTQCSIKAPKSLLIFSKCAPIKTTFHPHENRRLIRSWRLNLDVYWASPSLF